MPLIATRSDALRFEISGVEVQTLSAIGTIPGVMIKQVSALNAIGVGMIKSSGDGTKITWRAPGSNHYGTPIYAATDGEYLIEDGDSIGKFLRIEMRTAYLKPRAMQSRVFLKEVYLNGFGQDDITSDPVQFLLKSRAVTMKNHSTHTLKKIVVWVDRSSGVAIGKTQLGSFTRPTREETGLSFSDLAAGGTASLWMRQTISANEPADPKILDHIHARYYAPW